MQLQRQIDDLLAQRASEWIETLRTGGEAERAAFIDWLGESRLHVQEFLETVAIDRELDALDAEHQEDTDALLARIAPNVVPLPDGYSSTSPLRPNGREKAGVRWGLAATIAICSLAALFLFLHSRPSQEFSTRIGEQRTIELHDASVVHLNADSQIEVQFDESERSIRLLHGEALFKVARDVARPFRVVTDTATIQVLGTQFNVYEQPDGTRVSVLDGKVRIINSAGDSQTLTGGEEVLIARAGAIQKNEQPDVQRAIAWRQRRLVFDNAPLEDMVREFNRYNATTQIELRGVAPGSHHYDGIFDADDPASLAELLTREKDVTVEMRDRKILIRARQP